MSFVDNVTIIVEMVIADTEEESQVLAFYHHPTGKKLDWGFEGCWLVDFEGHHCDKVKLPTEKGKYRIKAEWNDDCEIIESIWSVEKVTE